MKRLLLFTLVVALGGCGKGEPRRTGGKWAAALRDPDARVRQKAAFTLGNIGPTDSAGLPALLGALADTDASVRCEVILALVKFGPAAREAIPTLTQLRQQDADAKVRGYAARALAKLRADK
jgi:HEAT repeat protein